MSALQQYIDFYNANSPAVSEHSAPVLNALRASALEALDGKSLPRKGDEGFEKTSIDKMMEPEYGININRMPLPVDVASSFRCGVPNMSSMMGIVVNDEFKPVGQLEQRLPEGVIFMSLHKAALQYPELVGRYYGTVAPLSDTSVALNTLLTQDGVFIYVPDGVTVEKPLQLVNIFSSPTPLMAFRRVLVVMGDNAKAHILVCDHTQDNTQTYHSSQVIEIVLGNASSLDYIDIEESSDNTSRYSQLFASQPDNSELVVNGTTLDCGNTRNDYTIEIPGRHCSTMIAGMAIGSGAQHIDNNTSVHHVGESCKSRQLFKYIIDDKSTGAFEGSIEVDEKARFTEAYQNDKNLLASVDARMHCKPQLLIYCDDVKCSHGASTGQLDKEALFYMRSRGIDEKVARTMLMQAFMADVIDTVTMPGLKERLHMLVEQRLHGQQGYCGDCSANCHNTPDHE